MQLNENDSTKKEEILNAYRKIIPKVGWNEIANPGIPECVNILSGQKPSGPLKASNKIGA